MVKMRHSTEGNKALEEVAHMAARLMNKEKKRKTKSRIFEIKDYNEKHSICQEGSEGNGGEDIYFLWFMT